MPRSQTNCDLLKDDLDGGEADESLTFALRGVEYESELSSKNALAFEKALERYMKAGRRVAHHRAPRGSVMRSSKSSSSSSKEHLAAVREWARESGYEVADRGRISGEALTAYEAAP